MKQEIEIMCIKQNMSKKDIAKNLGESYQNFHSKLKRDNFTERQLHDITEALNCDLKIELIPRETKLL